MTPFDPADHVPEGPSGERHDVARAARGGLCAACAHARAVPTTHGAVFVRCDHPDLPRYPAVPVIACDGFVWLGATVRAGG
jgi:hypothetical protein